MKLRFSIRDLLWLTFVVALAVGWWLDHVRLNSNDQVDYKMLPSPSYMTEQVIFKQDSDGIWRAQDLLSPKR